MARRHDGARCPARAVTGGLGRPEEGPRLTAIVRDITARKEADKAKTLLAELR